MIEIKNLIKEYITDNKPLLVIDNISTEISEGEFISIIGPSGCGKTTFIKLISDLTPPTSGKIFLNGKTPKQARLDRKIGVVFQHPVLLPWRTVLKNISLPGEIFQSDKIKNRASEIINLMRLAGFEEFLPREISGGMQSRVAIGMVLTFNPSFLFMDEPFGHLDDLTREDLNLEILKICKKSSITVIFVTHDLSEAIFLSDRIIVFSKRPAKILDITKNDLPYPRVKAIKESSEFIELRKKLREILQR